MKKILLIASIAGLAMVSCKKDRVCSCTVSQSITSNGTTTSQTEVKDVTIVKTSKRIAKLACIHQKSSNSGTGYTSTEDIDCKLK